MKSPTLSEAKWLGNKIVVAPDLADRLCEHAKARDIAPDKRLVLILETVLREDLVNAVLDDGK